MPPGHGDGQNHYSPKPVLSLKVPGLASFTVQRATRPAPRVLVSAGAMRSQPPRPRHPGTGFDQGGSHENDPGPSNGTSSAEATEDAPEDLRELSRDRVAVALPDDSTVALLNSPGGLEVAVPPAGSEEPGSTQDGHASEGRTESPQSTGTLSPGALSPALDSYPPFSWEPILVGAGGVEMSLPVPPGPPPEATAPPLFRQTSIPTVASHPLLPVAPSSSAVISAFDQSQPSAPPSPQQPRPLQSAAGASNDVPADIDADSSTDADVDACINTMRMTMHEKLRRLRGERGEEERLRRKAEDQAAHLQLLCEGQAAQLAESTQAEQLAESEAACCAEDTEHAAEFKCVPKNLHRLSLVELEDLQRRVQAYTQRIDSALVRAKAANEVQMSRMCNICYDQPRSLVFVPCGHTACTSCTEELQASTTWCHQCRSPIQSVLRLHDN
ncbi:hypothetical protein CYMTET_31926 [Cymbomonas tetramitiformis]|uniref:RING-type domain-containing protein n=1 Tax=Cymbomonas tetramitiformis TaxID=36881 RepID=A0AAE0FG15_9CHLO|nr:hypothetical protein CYMTET_31926 [Cymbomonas tetramitiformis]